MKQCTQKRNCVDCGVEFLARDIDWKGCSVFRQQRCEKCTEAAQKAYDAAEKAAYAERQVRAFAAVCPPLYQDTDPSKLHAKFRQATQNWQYDSRGLGLVGIAGTGKTRAAFLLIQRMLALGYKVQATTAATFAKLCVDQFAEDRGRKAAADQEIRSIYHADLWFLDDLGKQRMTERVEAELYAALEHRTAHMRPIIWTSNAMGDVLGAMFSEDRAEPIMRRLTEFSDIVTVWEDEIASIQGN